MRATAWTTWCAAAGSVILTSVGAQADEATEHARFAALTAELDQLEAYNEHLGALVESQRTALAQLADDRAAIDELRAGIGPLLARMLDTLEAFVAADTPVRAKRRQATVAGLRDLLLRADLPEAHKYRQLLAAYQSELELGRALSAYSTTVALDGAEVAVNVVAVGRLVVALQTDDGRTTRIWRASGRPSGWVAASGDEQREVATLLRIANRQTAPTWVALPLPAPVDAP